MQECDTWISEREYFFFDEDGKKVGLGLFYFEKLGILDRGIP